MSTAVVDQPLLSAAELAELAAQGALLAQGALRREVHDHHAGDWPSAWLGRGLDFEEARPYAPGDDVRDMDWRTTARLGHPFIKTYREERQPLLHIVLDRGPSMRFGTRRRLKVAQGARLAALLGFAAAERNVAVGATLWDSPQDRMLGARHGRSALLALLQALVEPCAPLPAEAGEAWHELNRLQTLRAELPRGSRLLLLSDFGWLDDRHEGALADLAQLLDLQAVCLSDPAERALPDLGLVCFAGDRGAPRWLDTGQAAVRAAHAAAFAERKAQQARRFARCGVHWREVGSEVDSLLPWLYAHG
ncbi:MAG: DUF58 domain-containing protein [Hylemonella sp.]|nr:DUF58 domain-containing protein [Hylemonella sp.]MDH5709001.1 DUF58 domain-containing protein [Hylemonella sp.]